MSIFTCIIARDQLELAFYDFRHNLDSDHLADCLQTKADGSYARMDDGAQLTRDLWKTITELTHQSNDSHQVWLAFRQAHSRIDNRFTPTRLVHVRPSSDRMPHARNIRANQSVLTDFFAARDMLKTALIACEKTALAGCTEGQKKNHGMAVETYLKARPAWRLSPPDNEPDCRFR